MGHSAVVKLENVSRLQSPPAEAPHVTGLAYDGLDSCFSTYRNRAPSLRTQPRALEMPPIDKPTGELASCGPVCGTAENPPSRPQASPIHSAPVSEDLAATLPLWV